MDKEAFEKRLSAKDFLVTGESFDLVYDPARDMLITMPQPDDDILGRYYDSDQYISHSDSEKGIISFLYQRVRRYTLKRKVGLISRINSGTGTLADLGAGTGAFLAVARENGWKINGVEPNGKARALAMQKGIFLEEQISNLKGNQFDVVTLWHVLEHLPNLENVVFNISNLVKPGGHLIIAVPNYKSYDAQHYKENWAAYDVPRHLWHFSRTSIKILFSDSLEFVKTKPMIFDSFYVSLLSEKYKTGTSFSLKAFFIGLWSNVMGWFTQEYSSLIYQFRKPN